MKLNPQQQKVYDYIKAHPGCTTHEITMDTFIQVPSARITEMRKMGVPILGVGSKRYNEETKAFECYEVRDGENEGVVIKQKPLEVVGLWHDIDPFTGMVLWEKEHEIYA